MMGEMSERESAPQSSRFIPLEYLPSGLPTAEPVGPGHVILTEHLVSPDERVVMDQSAEAIQLDLARPHMLPVAQDLFTAEPPHPATVPGQSASSASQR